MVTLYHGTTLNTLKRIKGMKTPVVYGWFTANKLEARWYAVQRALYRRKFLDKRGERAVVIEVKVPEHFMSRGTLVAFQGLVSKRLNWKKWVVAIHRVKGKMNVNWDHSIRGGVGGGPEIGQLRRLKWKRVRGNRL